MPVVFAAVRISTLEQPCLVWPCVGMFETNARGLVPTWARDFQKGQNDTAMFTPLTAKNSFRCLLGYPVPARIYLPARISYEQLLPFQKHPNKRNLFPAVAAALALVFHP